MYEQQQQHLSDSGFGDDSSWLAADDDLLRLPPHHQSDAGAAAATNSGNENLDRRLLKDLVEMVPLIEQFMVYNILYLFISQLSLELAEPKELVWGN